MAKRKDRFRIGQQVVLVLDESTQWERANGELGVVVGGRRYGSYPCARLHTGETGATQTGYRYAVRWKGGVNHFEEWMLRAIYDGEPLSTWAKFAKVVGLDARRLTQPSR